MSKIILVSATPLEHGGLREIDGILILNLKGMALSNHFFLNVTEFVSIVLVFSNT